MKFLVTNSSLRHPSKLLVVGVSMASKRLMVPKNLRALYQLIRKYPGVSTPSIIEMIKDDRRFDSEMRTADAISDMIAELRLMVESGFAPNVVKRALEVHDRMSKAGIGDAFRYIVRSVERGEYFGIRDIQRDLGRMSNSFQRKFNSRIEYISKDFPEVGEVYNSWLRLRYISNPIVQLNLAEW